MRFFLIFRSLEALCAYDRFVNNQSLSARIQAADGVSIKEKLKKLGKVKKEKLPYKPSLSN